MNDMSACCGCFVVQPPRWPYNAPAYIESHTNIIPPQEGLTDNEKICLNYLAEVWNTFSMLEGKHPSDNSEFLTAIHSAQKSIALRVARRLDKDIWKQYGSS